MMSEEFLSLQQQLLESKKNHFGETNSVFRVKEKLKKLQLEKQQLKRRFAEDSDEYKSFLKKEGKLKKDIDEHNGKIHEFLSDKNKYIKSFLPYTDPRKNISNLSDDYPILFFPIRLETRFKKISLDNENVQHQLWVRVFPDDCSIDTFDNVLSDSELKKAKNYLINRWKAGIAGNPEIKPFVRNKEIGAWKELMGNLKAGRAYWITQNFNPVNAEEIPARNNEKDILLIIPTEELPNDPLKQQLIKYWRIVFLSQGDSQKINEAYQGFLQHFEGDENLAKNLANENITKYRPINFDDEQFQGESPPEVIVSFLIFPKSDDVDTKLNSWSNAARVITLPERFVLLGFQNDNQQPIINEIGNFIPDPLIVGPDPGLNINEVLKEAYGEDFEKLKEEEKAEKYIEYLSQKSETKWLFDFDEAIDLGMAFRVNLTEEQYNAGFKKLFVVGVKMAANSEEGQLILQELIQHHHEGDNGFSIIPQGTPTNNAEDSDAGFAETEDPEEAFYRYIEKTTDEEPFDSKKKCDGKWLTDLLGIDDTNLNRMANYYGKDLSEAGAMNTALWNGTIGYFLESMLTPLFNDSQRELIRWYFTTYVKGRGAIPAIRIGKQPYGILPSTSFTKIEWLNQDKLPFNKEYSQYQPILRDIYNVIFKIKKDWEKLLDEVAHIGKDGDAHQILLNALGLHATSVDFDQRYAESFSHLFNLIAFKKPGETKISKEEYVQQGLEFLANFGYRHSSDPDGEIPILEKFFLSHENDVRKPLIDDRPLSETEKIRAYTDSGTNYIEWLAENAKNNHQNIKDQKGFSENRRPDALLYDMLRHAVNLEFSNSGLKLYSSAEILEPIQVNQARIDADFIGVRAKPVGLESKWDILYREDSRITSEGIKVVDHLTNLIKNGIINYNTSNLHEVIDALEYLKDVPTARLERALVEHLDCCSYRLDSWFLGLVSFQLNAMRYGGNNSEENPQKGIYLGAYGWLENVKPENKNLIPAELSTELKEIFDPNNENNPMIDNTNAGYVHAPSINQAQTAAVLRNAYISSANNDDAEVYKVNLSSERVRMALKIIEGMQQGQSLGALLGYQLERGLHDRNDEELDVYIYELRKLFPLAANQMDSTQIEEGKTGDTEKETERHQEEEEDFTVDKAITKIEASNVIDGLKLLVYIRNEENKVESEEEKKKKREYPFGIPMGEGANKLKEAEGNIRIAINQEVLRIMNIRDAIADLSLSESVHQIVQGNYDRASSVLDTYSKGSFPQTPDIIQTPTSGVGLTNRFAIHLPSGIPFNSGTTPRSKVEPAINEWLKGLFPDNLSEIQCKVAYQTPNYDEKGFPNDTHEDTVSMTDLNLEPIDLLYMIDVESEKSLTALDDRILNYIHDKNTLRPDTNLEIKYTEPVDGHVTFFEIAPMMRSLRALLIGARPLESTDMTLQNEANDTINKIVTQEIDSQRITTVKQKMDDTVSGIETNFLSKIKDFIDTESFETTLENKNQIIENIDAPITRLVAHLKTLNLFGIPQTGFGFIYDRKKTMYGNVYKKVKEYKKRWEDKGKTFSALIDKLSQVPESDLDRKIELLQKAERTISTSYSIPTPPVNEYENILINNPDSKKKRFDERFALIESFLAGNYSNLKNLVTAVNELIEGLDAFDFISINVDDELRQIVVFAEDLYNQVLKLKETLEQKSNIVQELLDKHNATGVISEKNRLLTNGAKELFGQDFMLIPEFKLTDTQRNELQNCINNVNQLLNFQLEEKKVELPVDQWLYGVSRVREKVGAWESMLMMAEGFNENLDLDLTPVQLPFKENDSWLGLEYPESSTIENDTLLYTAYINDSNFTKNQCGLIVDEWIEIIPAKKETTGVSFHYDRPNSEPPQTMLLATPSKHTGKWEWDDLLNALKDTLELAKLRAIEPDIINRSDYAQFLPATIATVTSYPVTIALNYALNANQVAHLNTESNG